MCSLRDRRRTRPCPRPTIASRSSSSTSSASCWSAISLARSARKVGVATFEGRFCRSRAALAATAVTRPCSTSSSPTASPAISSDSSPPSPSPFAFALKRSKEYSFSSVPSTSADSTPSPPGLAQDSDTAPSSLARAAAAAAATRACSAPKLVASAQTGDQHAALPAAGSVLVRDRDLLQPALRLAQLDQALKRRVVQRIALEYPHHARVRGGVFGRSPARADGDRRHQRRQSTAACSPGSGSPRRS